MDALRIVELLRTIGVVALLLWLLTNLVTILGEDFIEGDAKLSAVAGTVAVAAIGILVVLLAAKAFERLDRN